MKIGILTQPLRTNYGGLLQAFALQRVLARMNHDVITEEVPYNLKMKISLKSFLKSSLLWRVISFILRRIDFNDILLPSNKQFQQISRNTHSFIDRNINTLSYFDNDLFHSLDVIIVGSDQVWRPIYNHNISKYFLCGIGSTDHCKISYAASFGVDYWEFNKEQENSAKEGLSHFDAVSVREDSGVSLCREYLNKEAELVLDPTLLLAKEDYCKLLPDTKNFSGLYTYILDRNSFKESIISMVSKQLNIKEYTVKPIKEFKDLSLFKKMFSIVDEVVIPPVEDWIMGFRDADFVITDSFHGTVFSIIFQKQFVVIGNRSRGISRFISLLKLLKLENRLVLDNMSDIDMIFNNMIDYDTVEVSLTRLKKKSLKFLLESIK